MELHSIIQHNERNTYHFIEVGYGHAGAVKELPPQQLAMQTHRGLTAIAKKRLTKQLPEIINGTSIRMKLYQRECIFYLIIPRVIELNILESSHGTCAS